MLVGYARVSTREQETHLQIDALRAAGAQVIYEEKTSSVGQRVELRRCLRALRPGDVFMIYKLDRVARSLPDLLAILEEIRVAGALVKSLTEPLDTTTAMGSFVIQILGAVAQLERGIIRERSIAGQRAARDRGVLVGRRGCCVHGNTGPRVACRTLLVVGRCILWPCSLAYLTRW